MGACAIWSRPTSTTTRPPAESGGLSPSTDLSCPVPKPPEDDPPMLAHTVFFYNWYAAVAVYSGGIFGYVCYDCTHYFLHHKR